MVKSIYRNLALCGIICGGIIGAYIAVLVSPVKGIGGLSVMTSLLGAVSGLAAGVYGSRLRGK